MMRADLETTAGQWDYVCCECQIVLSTGFGVTTSTFEQCAACGNTNLRFIHVLEHPETKKQIFVGIECARVLTGDRELPQQAENETKRKEKWRLHYGTPGRCFTTEENLIDRGKR